MGGLEYFLPQWMLWRIKPDGLQGLVQIGQYGAFASMAAVGPDQLQYRIFSSAHIKTFTNRIHADFILMLKSLSNLLLPHFAPPPVC